MSSAHPDPKKKKTEIDKNLEVTQSIKQALGGLIVTMRWMNFSGCRPAVKVSIWANHGSNIFGVSDNLRFDEHFAILRESRPERITFF